MSKEELPLNESLIDSTDNTNSEMKKDNPLEKANIFSQFFFCWLTPLVYSSMKKSFDQKMHWNLHSYLKVHNRLPEFTKYMSKSKSVVRVMYQMFSYKMFFMITVIIYNVLDVMDVMMIFFLTQILNYYADHPEEPYDFVKLGLYFALFLVIEAIKGLMIGILDFTIFNEMVINKNCLTHTILEKSFNMPLGNASKSGKGNIINLIQVDCNTIKDKGGDISYLFYTAIVGAVSFSLCFYFIGVAFFIFLVINIVFMCFCFFLYKIKLNYDEQLLKFKDERISMLKNILKNLKFIKFHVFENLFVKLVYDKREREVSKLKVIFMFFVIIVFMNWLNPNISFLATLTYIFTQQGGVSVAILITFFKLFEFVSMFFRLVPYLFELFFKFKLVNIRMKTFLDLKEADSSHIIIDQLTQSRYIDNDGTFVEEEEILDRFDIEKEIAIEIIDGQFGYTNLGLEKLKDKKKENNENKDKQEKEEDISETDFELNDINLQIRSGELTFIIGKIGSGKTSLIYSLLGELQPKKKETKVIFSSDSIAYCPQTPFIQTKSVKENIAFYEPLDEHLLKKRIRMAALEEDLKLFDNGRDSMLGEGGSNISGGQKTRINLARCFYQEKDIYLLDDPLSSLDFNVACEIIENAIKKDLKGKTRVIVTHSIQYLLYADKIVYLDEGRICYDGDFETFKKSDMYRELEKTIDRKPQQKNQEVSTVYESHLSMESTSNLRFMTRKSSRDSRDMEEFNTAGKKKSNYELERIQNNLEKFNMGISKKGERDSGFKKKSSIFDGDQMELEKLWKKANNQNSSIQEFKSSDEDSFNQIPKKSEIHKDSNHDYVDEYEQMGELSPLSDMKLEVGKQGNLQDDCDETLERPLIQKVSVDNYKRTSREELEEIKEEKSEKLDDLIPDEKQKKAVQKYFLKEDKEEGRNLLMTAKLFLNFTGGFTLFLLILIISATNAFADYFCLNKLYDFIINFENEKEHIWSSLQYIYLYFLLPVPLVVIRVGIIVICSFKTSRKIHHKMTIKSLYGDLLSFHDRVETARLINRFSTDTDEIDKEIPYKISSFMLFTGFLVSDIIVGFLTIGWSIFIAYGVYYAIIFYYQNFYVKFKKDLYRLEAVTRTPIVNITNEILDGRLLIKTLKKEEPVMKEVTQYLEENSKNLTIQNGLTNWFSIRVSLFNVLIVQFACFVFIWLTLYYGKISLKKIILFLPFVLNFIWNIDFWISQFSQLETSLVSLERCKAFESIPHEKNYFNFKQIYKNLVTSNMDKRSEEEFIRKFELPSEFAGNENSENRPLFGKVFFIHLLDINI